MSAPNVDEASPSRESSPAGDKPVRLRIGIAIVALLWVLRFIVPIFYPDALLVGVLGGLGLTLAVLVWWAFFSRLPAWERWGGLAMIVAVFLLTKPLLHLSIGSGNMGMMFPIYLGPILSMGLVLWATVFVRRNLDAGPRRALLLATIMICCGMFSLVRTEGNTTDLQHEWAWRWTPTLEEQHLERTAQEAMTAAPASANAAAAAWPGFRGSQRDSVIRGAQVGDWNSEPPQELWRRSVGPGWSSFAVGDELLYTQEQHGEDELVSCYLVATGEPVWQHADTTRFWESVGGAGPRGTPTLLDGRVYALGATGVVNVLDALDGSVIWSRDAADDTGAALPTWGYSASPLVLDDLVLATASGALIAYDRETGEPRWKAPAGGEGYSSPQLLTIDDTPQIVQIHGDGVIGVAPADGALLWEHAWSGYPMVQPAAVEDGILFAASQQSGLRRLAIERGENDDWNVEERWTSIRLKPYFNDYVVHKGHAYGLDGTILAAIELENGERKWKGGRYGGGQLVLLADQDLLLVLSEKGELALVDAVPDGYSEHARIPGIQGKTWNHPVVIGDLLLVRNDREMAAFRL